MFKKTTYLMLVVWVLGLAHGGWATTKIIIVTNNPEDEVSYKPFLTNLLGDGITVEAVDDKYIDPLGVAAKADLAAANLIIVSRRTSSGKFVADIKFWNGLAVPMVLHSSFLIGDDRWRWMPGGTQNVDVTTVGVVAPTDLVFDGVTIKDGQVEISSTTLAGVDVSNQDSAGNGTKIATPAGNNRVMIARWAAGTEHYPGSGHIAGGPRLFFGMRTDEFLPFINDSGKKMLGNAILSILGRIGPGTSDPTPTSGETDVARDIVLGWTTRSADTQKDVYLGTAFQSVRDATRTNPLDVWVAQGQTANVYDPVGLLEFGQTYYWRVDEVNGVDLKVSKGTVWSFTIEPYAYPLQNITATASGSQPGMGPEKTVDGSGLNASDQHSTDPTAMWLSDGPQPAWIQYQFDKIYKLHQMWVWNSNQMVENLVGFGAKDVTVEYSSDGTAWTAVGETPVLAQATGRVDYTYNTTVNLGGAMAQYVKLTIKGSWSGKVQGGLSEVRFFYVPVMAFKPQPVTGATNIDPAVTLGWRPGREAASHEVRLGTDASNLPLMGTVTQNRFDTTGLDLRLGRTYSWKITEVNQATAPSEWAGDVWSFSTPDYGVVDDFESYDDNCKRIFFAWVDGFGYSASPACGVAASAGNGTGSTVGNTNPPFAETTLVHGGKQSMPLAYDNTSPAQTSSATRTFGTGQDWTRSGVKTLVLYVYGDPANGDGQLYIKVNDKKVTYSGTAGVVRKPWWTQWAIDLGSLGVDLKKIVSLSIGIDGAGTKGIVYVDSVRLYGVAPTPPLALIEAESGTLTSPMRMYDDPGASGGKCIGTENLGFTGTHLDGVAKYSFTVTGGTYTIQGRVIDQPTGRNSFWVRVKGATLDVTPDVEGWLNWNFPSGATWHWAAVSGGGASSNPVAHFTLAAGTYTLEIAYQKDGARLDAIVITMP